MAFIVKDRVRETSTTTGTGPLILAGAVTGFQGFSSIGNGNTTHYCIAGAADWEVGVGTVVISGSTVLQRTSVLASSNGGSLVNFSSEPKQVFVTFPANSSSGVDIQEFTTPGSYTWVKPVGARFVEVLMYGGGGGGGSGRRRGALVAASITGGSGGAAGSRMDLRLPASALSSTETVVVGAGGAGGAPQTVDNTNGITGSFGGDSTFATLVARGGGTGFGGIVFAGTAVSGGLSFNSIEAVSQSGSDYTAAGGASNSGTSFAGSAGGLRGGGGAGGAGLVSGGGSTNTAFSGGLGGTALTTGSTTTGGGGAGGSAGGNGSNGADSISGNWTGGSGGGGGSSFTLANAGAGGNGGFPGGGGGGGGASEAFDSGAGGNGGNGFVRVVTYL